MHFFESHSRRLVLIVAAAVACAVSDPASLVAQTIDFEPVLDNTLYEDSLGALSNGLGDHCFVGITAGDVARRALFAFDLSAIPSTAIITSVVFRLTMDRGAAFSGPRDVTLHRVTASWGEGTSMFSDPFFGGGLGAPSTAGDATWLHRFYPGDLWAQAGGDFDPTPVATTAVPPTPAQYEWGSTPEMVSLVQSWVNAPSGNFGWLLRGDETASVTARRFFTREATNASNRPHLLVTYEVPSDADLPSARALHLDPATPNPFNPSTTLRWETATGGFVRISVWDVRGTEVAMVFAGERGPGPQSFVWQARDARGLALPSGVYVVRLEHAGQTRSQRVVLLR